MGTDQRALRATDVSNGFDRMRGIQHRRARDDEWLTGRLGGLVRARHMTRRTCNVASKAVLLGEVLAGHDLALGVVRSSEPIGGQFVERDRLSPPEPLERHMCEDQRRPGMLTVSSSQGAKALFCFTQGLRVGADPAQAHQVIVRPWGPIPGFTGGKHGRGSRRPPFGEHRERRSAHDESHRQGRCSEP